MNPLDSAQIERTDIAIVGMAVRFPGAPDLATFWDLVASGRTAIRRLSDEALDALEIPPEVRTDPAWVPVVSSAAALDRFDAAFFGYSPREAELMDPQQRLMLELAWEALEQAGIDPARFDGTIGITAGATISTYLLTCLLPDPEVYRTVDPLQLVVGNAADSLTTRVSYKLDLRGPSHAIQSACSTSLLAVHQGCQWLLNEECDLVLVGGVSIHVPGMRGYRHTEGSIVSPDGCCRPFDARADGTVFGSGGGIVVLKRAEEALRDGDPIRALIKGSAANNDGAARVGFTAPSVEGQAAVISEALAASGIDVETLGYVEAHGTGTSLGDPIEIQALTRALGEHTARRRICPIGTLKHNIGHLDVAAGIAGLIKTVLALEHHQRPPSAYFQEPNPRIDFDAAPIFVSPNLEAWPPPARGRRHAGVSAFGFGGTNVHVILEEAPPPSVRQKARPWQVLPVSARSAPALDEARSNLARHLETTPLALPEVAATLALGRRAFSHRCAIVAADPHGAVIGLRGLGEQTLPPPGGPEGASAIRAASGLADERGRVTAHHTSVGLTTGKPPPVVFMFPGQGTQHPQMARALYEEEPIFREAVDGCARMLEPQLGLDLRSLLYPDPASEAAASEQLRETALAQPALFVIEYALARLWMAWGVRPTAMIGHSLGEIVAACLADVFSLEDALALVALRGRLMQSCPPGAMLAVPLDPEALMPGLDPALGVAARNEPGRCVVAGSVEAIARLERTLLARGLHGRRLATSHAFHSASMEPILEPFAAAVARLERHPPSLPIVSNRTGTWIRPEQAQDPAYWARHLREPVRFAEGLSVMAGIPGQVYLEVGPGQTLSGLARRQVREGRVLASLAASPGGEPDRRILLEALAGLWTVGVEIDWDAFQAGRRQARVPLPTYPFERRRYWIGPSIEAALEDGPPSGAPRHSPGNTGSRGEDAALLPHPTAQVLDASKPPRGSISSQDPRVGFPDFFRTNAAPLQSEPSTTSPRPLHARPELSTPFRAPRTALEASIAGIWREVLGVDRVGLDDNFFELGGDSFIAVQVVQQVSRRLGHSLQVVAAYEALTVCGMAARIAQAHAPSAPFQVLRRALEAKRDRRQHLLRGRLSLTRAGSAPFGE